MLLIGYERLSLPFKTLTTVDTIDHNSKTHYLQFIYLLPIAIWITIEYNFSLNIKFRPPPDLSKRGGSD